MTFYHGSRVDNIDYIDPERSVDKYAYFTPNLIFAIYFGGSPITNWDFNKDTNKLRIRELCEDYLKKVYFGVKEFIYVNDEDILDYEDWNFRNRDSIRTGAKVKVRKYLTIDNVYDKLIDLHNKGEIEIEFWQDMDEKTQSYIYQQNKNVLCADIVNIKKEFPELYNILIKIYPDKKV